MSCDMHMDGVLDNGCPEGIFTILISTRLLCCLRAGNSPDNARLIVTEASSSAVYEIEL